MHFMSSTRFWTSDWHGEMCRKPCVPCYGGNGAACHYCALCRIRTLDIGITEIQDGARRVNLLLRQ